MTDRRMNPGKHTWPTDYPGDTNSDEDHIVGTEGNDVIYGGPNGDNLQGVEGNDTLYGGEGNDFIFASGGDDIVWGGSGYDDLIGYIGNDILYGEEDDDKLTDSYGNDKIYGGPGNDSIADGVGENLFVGELGDDHIRTSGGTDTFVFAPTHGNDDYFGFEGAGSPGGDMLEISDVTTDQLRALYGLTVEVGDPGVSSAGDNMIIDFTATPWGGNGTIKLWGLADEPLSVGIDIL